MYRYYNIQIIIRNYTHDWFLLSPCIYHLYINYDLQHCHFRCLTETYIFFYSISNYYFLRHTILGMRNDIQGKKIYVHKIISRYIVMFKKKCSRLTCRLFNEKIKRTVYCNIIFFRFQF